LATHILARVGRLDLLQAVPFVPSDFRARRPRHCALRNTALEREGIHPRHWRDALGHYLTSLGLRVGTVSVDH
jgi:dTDP-4-dehydrorhamnose reductase